MISNDEHVMNANMYIDCAQYSLMNRNATRTCITFSAIGGISGLLALPTTIFATLSEAVLMAGFVTTLKRSAKQHIYGSFECVVGILFCIYVGLFDLFLSKGFTWLGFEPLFIEYTHPYTCKGGTFIKCFLLACMANLTFADAVNRATAIKAKCYQPVTGKKCILILCCCIMGGFAAALPEFLVSDNWIIDGRLYCGKDPVWAPTVIKWIIFHDALMVNGIGQALAIFLVLTAMARDLGKLDNTIDYLHTAHRLPGEITETMFQVTFLLRESRRDAWATIIYTGSMGALMLIRGIIRLSMDYEIYIDFEDNGKTSGVLSFYMYIALDDLCCFLMMIVYCYHFWIFFYYVPAARTWVFGETSERRNILQRHIDAFLPINPDADDFQEGWDSATFYMNKGNPVLYDRIADFQTVIKTAQSDVNHEKGGVDGGVGSSMIEFKKKN